MMRKALVSAATILTFAVAIAACSSGSSNSSGKKIVTGLYAASNYQPGADTCAGVGNFDPTPFNWPIYVNGSTVNFSDGLAVGSGQTATAFHVTSAGPYHHQRVDQLFCTEADSYDITGTSTGKGGIDVTFTQHWAKSGGSQCDLLNFPLPCDATMSFHLQLNGTPDPESPPTVPVTGAMTGSTDVAPLVDAESGLGHGYMLDYDASLGTATIAATGSNQWYCNAALATNGYFNYTVYEVPLFRQFYMMVATNQWAVGDHAVNPDSTVYIEITNEADHVGRGATGTLHLSTAGTVQEVPGNNCQFTLTGVTLDGTAVGSAFAPQDAQSLQTERRAMQLRGSRVKPKQH